jgi:hypothetical protein
VAYTTSRYEGTMKGGGWWGVVRGKRGGDEKHCDSFIYANVMVNSRPPSEWKTNQNMHLSFKIVSLKKRKRNKAKAKKKKHSG